MLVVIEWQHTAPPSSYSPIHREAPPFVHRFFDFCDSMGINRQRPVSAKTTNNEVQKGKSVKELASPMAHVPVTMGRSALVSRHMRIAALAVYLEMTLLKAIHIHT